MKFKSLLVDESGATSIEYALMCAGIAMIILAALNMTGERVLELFTSLLGAFA